MRRFVINVILVLVTAACILVMLTLIDGTSLRRASHDIGSSHIVAMGASNMSDAMNEKYYPGLRNLSRAATQLDYLVPLLPRVLDENPDVDTVLLAFSRLNALPHKDVPRPTIQIYKHLMPFIFYDIGQTNWKRILLDPAFLGAILNPDIEVIMKSRPTLQDFDLGSCELQRHDMSNIRLYEKNRREMGGVHFTDKQMEYWAADNLFWATKGIEICRQRNVVPVLFMTPLYQFDRWLDKEDFKRFMLTVFPADALVADYEDFEFPDDSYYGDVHHLNSKGANYFTSYLARNGIKVQKLHDWLKEKGY